MPSNLPERRGRKAPLAPTRAAKLLERQAIDFERQLTAFSGFLDERGYRHALVEALALAAYGLARTTIDLDLAVDAAAQPALVAFLEESGYETLHRSEGYSNHLHADPSRGRIDFVYLDPKTADASSPPRARSRVLEARRSRSPDPSISPR